MFIHIYIYITGAENEARYYQKGKRKKTKIIIYNNMACAAVGGCEPTKLRVTTEQECLACSSTTCTYYILIYTLNIIGVQYYTRARVNQQEDIIKYTYNIRYVVVVKVAIVVVVVVRVRIMQGHNIFENSCISVLYTYNVYEKYRGNTQRI